MWIEKRYRSEYQDCSKKGLRLRFEKSIDPDLRNRCIAFCKWLRSRYYFPLRVNLYFYDNAYFINQEKVKAYGLFFDGDERIKKFPRIWIATDQKGGINGILSTVVHELTHYFQWYFYDTEKRNTRSLEIEANRWGDYLLNEYQNFGIAFKPIPADAGED